MCACNVEKVYSYVSSLVDLEGSAARTVGARGTCCGMHPEVVRENTCASRRPSKHGLAEAGGTRRTRRTRRARALTHRLLRAQESLLEPKGIYDSHRGPPPDGPVPEPEEGVVADGQLVQGVRIGAAGALEIDELDLDQRKRDDCLAEEFVLDAAGFDFVPVALLLGVPLMFKVLREVPTEGEKAEELRYETKMYVYKLMTTPGLGLPITWNQNGAGTKLPPVLACRSDGVPFTEDDWSALCEFHEYLDENYVQEEQLWYTNRAEYAPASAPRPACVSSH